MPFLINNFFSLFIFFSKNFIEQKLIDIFFKNIKKNPHFILWANSDSNEFIKKYLT